MKRSPLARILFWVAVTLIAAVTLFPFYWTVRTALTLPRGVYAHPTAFLPRM